VAVEGMVFEQFTLVCYRDKNLRVSSRYHLPFIRKLIRGLTDLVWNRSLG